MVPTGTEMVKWGGDAASIVSVDGALFFLGALPLHYSTGKGIRWITKKICNPHT
jgi:hypothetical protein